MRPDPDEGDPLGQGFRLPPDAITRRGVIFLNVIWGLWWLTLVAMVVGLLLFCLRRILT